MSIEKVYVTGAFQKELEHLLNRHGVDAKMDMADYLLANMISLMINEMIFAKNTQKRLEQS